MHRIEVIVIAIVCMSILNYNWLSNENIFKLPISKIIVWYIKLNIITK